MQVQVNWRRLCFGDRAMTDGSCWFFCFFFKDSRILSVSSNMSNSCFRRLYLYVFVQPLSLCHVCESLTSRVGTSFFQTFNFRLRLCLISIELTADQRRVYVCVCVYFSANKNTKKMYFFSWEDIWTLTNKHMPVHVGFSSLVQPEQSSSSKPITLTSND